MRGKVAIVTGASRGIGKAIALGFAKEGAKVVVAARSETAPNEKLPGTIHETVAEIEKLGGEAIAVRCDVTDEASVAAMVEAALQRFGRIDILVNNAAIDFPFPAREMPLKRWDIVLKVNATGPFLCAKAVLPSMIAQGGGSIVNITSNAGAERGQRNGGLQRHLRRLEGRPRPLHLGPGRRGGQEQHRGERREAVGSGQHRGHAHVGQPEDQIGLEIPRLHGGLRHLPRQAGRKRGHGLRGLRRRVRMLARPQGRRAMRAVVYEGPEDIRLEEVPEPVIQDPEDAIVRVTTTSICGSDLHIVHGLLPKMEPGRIIGHEFTGVVSEVGSAVTRFKPGDRVLGAAAVWCGRCAACKKGIVSACERGATFGHGPLLGDLPGAQADYVRVPFSDNALQPITVPDDQIIFAGDILPYSLFRGRRAHARRPWSAAGRQRRGVRPRARWGSARWLPRACSTLPRSSPWATGRNAWRWPVTWAPT